MPKTGTYSPTPTFIFLSETLINFTSETFDIDGTYDASAAKWTPTAGHYLIYGEVVLQSPARIYGLLAFFVGVSLTQILLVLKKKQVEKVQAAEGI